LEGHTDFVYSLSFSPDCRTLCSGSWDKGEFPLIVGQQQHVQANLTRNKIKKNIIHSDVLFFEFMFFGSGVESDCPTTKAICDGWGDSDATSAGLDCTCGDTEAPTEAPTEALTVSATSGGGVEVGGLLAVTSSFAIVLWRFCGFSWLEIRSEDENGNGKRKHEEKQEVKRKSKTFKRSFVYSITENLYPAHVRIILSALLAVMCI